MVSVFASSVVESKSGQTKDYNISMCFSPLGTQYVKEKEQMLVLLYNYKYLECL
jgi:hypothetical protein